MIRALDAIGWPGILAIGCGCIALGLIVLLVRQERRA
jgi:hypothetical protein